MGEPTKADLEKIANEKAKFRGYKQEFEKKTCAQLKELLQKNDQTKTGNKSALVTRIARCKLYGCLPRCPECGGGRLKAAYVQEWGHEGNGTFSCPGYFDDDE